MNAQVTAGAVKSDDTKDKAKETTQKSKSEKKVSFVVLHQMTSPEEPDILLDSGSTISLFKDKDYLENVKDTKNRLVMETNAGSRIISRQGMIAGHGTM